MFSKKKNSVNQSLNSESHAHLVNLTLSIELVMVDLEDSFRVEVFLGDGHMTNPSTIYIVPIVLTEVAVFNGFELTLFKFQTFSQSTRNQ